MGWVDTFRGLAIILVVFAHCGRGLDKAGLSPGFEHGFLDDWIYAFHMPAFFFVAGLFAGRSLARGWTQFIAGKLGTVAYPYLVWSVIYILTLLILPAGNTKYDHSLWTRIAYAPVGNYWFLYTLFFVQFLFSLIRPWPYGPAWFTSVTLAMWVLESTGALEAVLPHATWWAWHNVLKYAVYFAFGDLVALISAGDRGVPRDTIGWSAIFFGGMTLLLAFGCAPEQGWFDLPLAMAGIQGLWEFSIFLDGRGAPPWLEYLGRKSLEIFVAHNFFTVATRLVLVALGVTDSWVHLGVGTVVGIVGSLALAAICERIGLSALFRIGRG